MKSGEFATSDYYASGIGYREWLRRERRRERLIRFGLALAIVVAPAVVALLVRWLWGAL